MTGSTSASTTSREIVRRMVAGGASSGEAAAVSATELQDACARACRNLRESIGEEGCAALLDRAFARTEADHPALRDVPRDGGFCVNGVAVMVEGHGLDAAREAIEALFAALLDVLGRLIGDDMARRIIMHDVPRSRPDAGSAP